MTRLPLRAAAGIVLVLAASMASATAAVAQERPLTVFAAASLKNALDEVARSWTRRSDIPVRVSYAGSPALARQIEGGAPADLFVSADTDWMDYLQAKKLIRSDSRRVLLGNSLVLVAATGRGDGPVTIGRDFPLASLLGDGRLAVAATATVPAGRYAKAALQRLELWNSVANRLAEAENVRAALAFVARGEVPLGIVYATDAAAEPSVAVIGRFPAGSHPPIVYPAAILAASSHPRAEEFLRYLAGPEARMLFEKHGFTVAPTVSPS